MAATTQDRIPRGLHNSGNRCWINAATQLFMNLREVRAAADTIHGDVENAGPRELIYQLEQFINPNGSPAYPTSGCAAVPWDFTAMYSCLDTAMKTRKCRDPWQQQMMAFSRAWNSGLDQLEHQTHVSLTDVAKALTRCAIYDYHHSDTYGSFAGIELMYASAMLITALTEEQYLLPQDGVIDDHVLSRIAHVIGLVIGDHVMKVNVQTTQLCDYHAQSDAQPVLANIQDELAVNVAPFGDTKPEIFAACATTNVDILDVRAGTPCSVMSSSVRVVASHTHHANASYKIYARQFSNIAVFHISHVSVDVSGRKRPVWRDDLIPHIPATTMLHVRTGASCARQEYRLVGSIHANGYHFTAHVSPSLGNWHYANDIIIEPAQYTDIVRRKIVIVAAIYERSVYPVLDHHSLLTSINATRMISDIRTSDDSTRQQSSSQLPKQSADSQIATDAELARALNLSLNPPVQLPVPSTQQLSTTQQSYLQSPTTSSLSYPYTAQVQQPDSSRRYTSDL